MSVVRTYRCNDCGTEWDEFLMHAEEAPEGCPKCEATGEFTDDLPYIQLPSRAKIGGSNLARSADATYRQVEASSEVRAGMAEAEMTQQLQASGVPAEEAQRQAAVAAREVKVTNMHDNLRVGDVAAMPPAQPSAEYQAQIAAAGGHQFWQGHVHEAISMAKTGSERGTGGPVLDTIQNNPNAPHKRMRGQLIRP